MARKKKKEQQGMKKQYVEKSVWELALERTRYIYDLFDTVAVSFSGGKDSTATLHVALQVAKERGRLPLYVYFFDEEAIPYEVEHYVRRVAQRDDVELKWYCVPIKHTNACSAEADYWIPWHPGEKDLWVRPMPPEAITYIPGYNPSEQVFSIPEMHMVQFPPHIYGRTCALMGIRAGESLTRFQAVNRREKENFLVQVKFGDDFGSAQLTHNNVYKGYPIYDWETADVWTAPALYDWDYCFAYDIMEMAGISHFNQRIAPPYGTQPARNLWMFKHCFPDIWDKMQKRVPGANTAALYMTTDLYAEGRVEKPEGIDWPDFIQQLLAEVPSTKLREALAKEIRKNINTHTSKSGGLPILPFVPHPDTGITYDLLAKKIIRRDNKGRIRPDQKMVSPDNQEKFQAALQKYYQARHEYEMEQLGMADGGTRF